MNPFSPQIFQIQRYSIHDGPGIRTTLFFQGCPLACDWCHNPESQAMVPSSQTSDSEKQEKLVRDLMVVIEKDRIYYEESSGGVTFSGGEPLCQADLVVSLAQNCRDQEIHTCLDTCGFAPWSVLERAARAVDTILFDIKVADPDLHCRVTGKPSNQVLANLVRLGELSADLVLRFPLIPGKTDPKENLARLADRVLDQTPFRRLHVLPFHHIAQGKYEQLKRQDPMEGILPPSDAEVKVAADYFSSRGFDTRIGG